MSIEDSGIFCPDRFGNALLHLQNLHTGLNKRRFKATDFIPYLGRGDAITHDLVRLLADDIDFTAGDSGRNASSFEPIIFSRFVAAHPLGRVRQMSTIANSPFVSTLATPALLCAVLQSRRR